MDVEFASEWSICVWIFIYATTAVCELQAKIGGSITMASVHVQSVQHIY